MHDILLAKGFYRIFGCEIEKQPPMFSNTPKIVVIFKETITIVQINMVLEQTLAVKLLYKQYWKTLLDQNKFILSLFIDFKKAFELLFLKLFH